MPMGKNTKIVFFSKCLLRHGVLRGFFMSFCVLVFVQDILSIFVLEYLPLKKLDMCLYTLIIIHKSSKMLSILKPLSHRSGVLTAFPQRLKNAERRGARCANASNAVERCALA